MGLNDFSDYGSGGSSISSTSWTGLDKWPSSPVQHHHRATEQTRAHRSSSYLDLVMGRCTLDDVMKEFSMNGSDSPYNPDEDKIWNRRADDLIGMGPSSTYLRQKSWPAAERARARPRPASEWLPSPTAAEFASEWLPSPTAAELASEWLPSPTAAELASEWLPSPTAAEFASSPTPPAYDLPEVSKTPVKQRDTMTEEQTRVLSSLPNTVLYSLLRELESDRRVNKQTDECRFCKNNGERESYVRSHALKDARGRVACPVLRAFVCARCGASGDRAHTIKYCPLTTNEERIKSAAMMRSVRMASGRRRSNLAPSVALHDNYEYVVFGEATPNVHSAFRESAPLDPLWAALEQKLML